MDSRGAHLPTHSLPLSEEALVRRMLWSVVLSYVGAVLMLLSVLVGVGRIGLGAPISPPDLVSHAIKDWSERFGFDRPNLGAAEGGDKLENCPAGAKIS